MAFGILFVSFAGGFFGGSALVLGCLYVVAAVVGLVVSRSVALLCMRFFACFVVLGLCCSGEVLEVVCGVRKVFGDFLVLAISL